MKRALILLAVSALMSIADGQTVPIQPYWTATDKVSSLIENAHNLPRRVVSSRILIHTDNNVLPLKLGDKETLPAIKFGANSAYYFHTRFKELGFSYLQWSLHYGHGKADFYEGNKDAAQLYLDAKSNTVGGLQYDVVASLRRTHLHRWTLSYTIPIQLSEEKGQCTVALHWLRMHRLQHGVLKGQMLLGQFQGDLKLLTTRGLPENETRSNGVALDVAVVLPLGKQFRMGVWVENLFSRIWQRTLQDITAKVVTNTIEPDADGFLHAVPFMQGRIDRRSLNAKARQVWTIGMAWQQRKGACLLLTEHDASGMQVSIGYALALSGRQHVWLMRTVGKDRWLIGVNIPQCQFHLSFDGFNANKVKRVSTSFCWSFAY